MHITSRTARMLRAVVVASFATLISLLSHVLAGGEVPGLIGVLLPLSLSVLVCLIISGRKFSQLRLIAMVVFSQLLFHSMFMMGAGDGSHLVNAQVGHAHHSLSMNLSSTAVNMDDASMHAGWLMLLAHALAAVVTILVLHRGECALGAVEYIWRILSWRVLRLLLTVFTAPRPQLRIANRCEPLPLISKLLESCVARRGPPAQFAK